MDRNQLRNIQGFLHPCYMISSSSWLILATVSAPLNLSIFQDDVSARIDWILIQDGVVRPFWRGLIRRPLAKEFSAVLMCRFSSALLTGSLLRHLVCSVDISVCFLPPFSVLHFLAYFTPTWNTHFIISKTYSCRSFQLFIIPIILSILSNLFLINRLPIILSLLFLDS